LMLDSVRSLVDLGAEVSAADMLELFGSPQPESTEGLLKVRSEKLEVRSEGREAEVNAGARERAEARFLAGATRLLGHAASEYRAGLTAQVRELVTAEDDELVNAAQAFLERLPESVDQDPAQVRAWETLLASSLVNGLAAGGGLREVNAFDPLKHNRNHLGQFSPKYARPSVAAQTPAWQDKKERVLSVVQSAVQSQGAITQEWVDYAEIDGAEAQAIAQRTMDARDINGWKRVLTSNEAWKIVRDHGQDPKPIQTDDFLKLPELLASPVSQDWVSRKGKPDVLKSIIQEASGNLIIVEEERVGRRKLALLSMYRP